MSTVREKLEAIAAYTISADDEATAMMRTWQWGQGVALYALTKAYEHTGDERILDYVENWLDKRLERGLPGHSINTTAPVLAALRLMRLRNSRKYIPLCESFANWCLHEAPRSLENAYEHSCTENVYPNQIWADTLFMGGIFLAEWGAYTGDLTYTQEALRQFVLHYKYLGDADTGLLVHGYYGNEGKQVGTLWGRGNGWFAASSVDVLPYFEQLPAYETALNNYRKHTDGFLPYQDPFGAWHTVINDASTYLEASVTAAFAYGLNEGIRKGLLPAGPYRDHAKRAIEELSRYISPEGRVLCGSDGTCVMPTAAEYNAIGFKVTAFTQGLAMLACMSEMAIESSIAGKGG